MITVELKGVQEIQAKLQKACNVAGTKSVLEGVGDIVVDAVQRNFRNEGIGNRKWKQSEAAKKRNGQTLTDKQTLRRSVHRTNFDGNQVLVGTNVPYGRIHHFGGKTGRKHKTILPARPWLEVDEAGMNRVLEFVQDKIEETLKGN